MNNEYRPSNDDFFAIPCKRGESRIGMRKNGRTKKERKKQAARLDRRYARDHKR